MESKDVKELLENGNSFSDMWLKFSQRRYPYDDNFKSVSSYMIGKNKDNYTLKLKKDR